MKLLIAMLVVLSVAGCTGNTRPTIPETVTVVIQKYKPLPAWATDPLPYPVAKDGTVRSRLSNENARGEIIKLANCDRSLLKKLDAGEAVNRQDCDTK